MKTLYVISRSPFMRHECNLYFRLADESDGILFIQDGVLLASAIPEPIELVVAECRARGTRFYFCTEDLAARGIQTDYEKVDYDAIVQLFETYKKVI
jgi:sulfur relay protein TusB/DsrH